MDPTFGEMLDTTPEARARYYALLAALGLEARAQKVARLSRAVRDLARADIRRVQPHASPEAVELALVERLYGAEVATRLAPNLVPGRE